MSKTTLTVGQNAPDFVSTNQNGESVSLSKLKGKKVVLYFYPKDDTPGCTAEACNLRDNYNVLIKNGFTVLGVSPDSETSHQKFIKKHSLPFDLIADTDKSIANAYGVWVEKSMYGRKYMGIARTTFIIDEQGKIAEIIEKVDTKDHTNQIL
ncbi:MAG: thioredoxin-dependent thiol peroxidase [Bacteroidetes bacterium]|nr:thioredoxin-dependent thiol peroxidase [Bacteroidota bacterium]